MAVSAASGAPGAGGRLLLLLLTVMLAVRHAYCGEPSATTPDQSRDVVTEQMGRNR